MECTEKTHLRARRHGSGYTLAPVQAVLRPLWISAAVGGSRILRTSLGHYLRSGREGRLGCIGKHYSDPGFRAYLRWREQTIDLHYGSTQTYRHRLIAAMLPTGEGAVKFEVREFRRSMPRASSSDKKEEVEGDFAMMGEGVIVASVAVVFWVCDEGGGWFWKGRSMTKGADWLSWRCDYFCSWVA